MIERSVAVIVHQEGHCPLLTAGARWIFDGRELLPGGGRVCATGVCSIYPQLQDILKAAAPDAALPDGLLSCGANDCGASFRMELASAAALSAVRGDTQRLSLPASMLPSAAPTSSTRRLERGAASATNLLKKQAPFLSRLSKELAAEVISACTTRRYDGGEIILMQGVIGEHLYIVAEGLVEVARFGKSSDETILVTLGVGECFGEMSILTGEVTSAEVRSHGASAILTIARDDLEALLLKRPALSREFSKLLAARLKATNLSLESELSRGVLGKLSMIALLDLVQTLHQSRRTGTLVLSYAGQQARLGFSNGALCTAMLGELAGDEVFYTVMC